MEKIVITLVEMMRCLWAMTVVMCVLTKSECRNNVCKTMEDYNNMDNNPNCYYNPDADLSPVSIDA